MNKRKIAWLVVIVLAVILIIVMMKNRGGLMSSRSSSSPTPTASPSAKPASPLSYNAAVKKYASTRMQFDDRCQMTPATATYKNGTTIMLDNRSKVARTIKLDSTQYSLVAYGFRLVTLSYSKLPRTLVVDCGSAQNVGTILIQK